MKQDRRRDTSAATATAIKDLIASRNLRPGDPMPTEAELVDEIGVSRSSVREAVRTLVALDILGVRHGTGTFVGQLSLRPFVEAMVFRGMLLPGDQNSRLREVVEVRTLLDMSLAPAVVADLAAHGAPELHACVDRMHQCAARGEPFPHEDRTFHLLLARRVPNGVYEQLVTAFWDIHMTVAPGLGVISARDLDETAHAHELLLTTALAGDVDGYREAVKGHYEPILRVLAASPGRA